MLNPKFQDYVSEAEQAGLSLTWLQTPEDTFSHEVAQLYCQVTWEGECSETEATVKADEEAAQKAEDDKHLKDIDVKSKYCFRLLCEYDQVGDDFYSIFLKLYFNK